ncbi:MAG TPA: hypothetical protein VD927_17210 [Chryseosolibacter sp.]|nr:hypothetical protein [Chryseosolibacter sp.]
MFLKARSVNFLVVLLMFLQIVGASANAQPTSGDRQLTLHAQKPPSSIIASFLFEKTEEGSEKTEEEKDRMARVVLIDFSRITFSLSLFHSPHVQLAIPTFQYNVRPPLHQVKCVFLI